MNCMNVSTVHSLLNIYFFVKKHSLKHDEKFEKGNYLARNNLGVNYYVVISYYA